jgi:hypothetical protein
MKPIRVPTTDVNSETAILVEWRADAGATVTEGEIVAEVETSKSVVEVAAPGTGVLFREFDEGAEVLISQPIGAVFPDTAALEAHVAAHRMEKGDPSEARGYRASAKAEVLAKKLGVDLSKLDFGERLITTKDVENAAIASAPAQMDLPSPLARPKGSKGILLIGGGLGATQVVDILSHDSKKTAVAAIDDDPSVWGTEIAGIPIIGGSERIEALFKAKAFDGAIVTISTSVPARKKFRELCAALEIPLENAIDPTARICRGVEMGGGNVVCGFCHFGTETKVGDNNFFSAYNSFDHHNVIGNDISTGPGCMSSALVTFGDRVRMGTSCFFEPYIEIGAGVQIASGVVVRTSVPDDHAVKVKTGQFSVVPIRRR